MRKYPLPTKEEAEELRRLRQEAGMSIPQMAEAFIPSNQGLAIMKMAKEGLILI